MSTVLTSRQVYTRESDRTTIRLSGVGALVDSEWTVPFEYEQRYDDLALDQNSTIDVFLNPSSLKRPDGPNSSPGVVDFWGFAFHTACWNLLTALFQPNLSDLVNVCLSTRRSVEGILDWGHNYGGVVFRLDKYYSRLWFSGEPSGEADPFNVASVGPLIQAAVRLEDSRDGALRRLKPYKMDGDMFQRLPPEVLHEILIVLPSQDVQHLRSSSPAFANLGLSEMFWASRFQRGHELHCIFETKKTRPSSWRSLYQSVRGLQMRVLSLANRKRVWELALALEELMDQVSGSICHGQILKSLFEPNGIEDTRTWHTAGRGVKGLDESFDWGARSLRTRLIELGSRSRVRELWISFVRSASGSHVSGLRFILEDGNASSIGYIHANQEIRVAFPSDDAHHSYTVSGWRLAFDTAGVRAISVITEHGESSSWAGDAKDVPRWCLCKPGTAISSVRAEFDVGAFSIIPASERLWGFFGLAN